MIRLTEYYSFIRKIVPYEIPDDRAPESFSLLKEYPSGSKPLAQRGLISHYSVVFSGENGETQTVIIPDSPDTPGEILDAVDDLKEAALQE